MKTAMKKLFSLMLVAVLLVGVMPFQAFAAETVHVNVELEPGKYTIDDSFVAKYYTGAGTPTDYFVHNYGYKGDSFELFEKTTVLLAIEEFAPVAAPDVCSKCAGSHKAEECTKTECTTCNAWTDHTAADHCTECGELKSVCPATCPGNPAYVAEPATIMVQINNGTHAGSFTVAAGKDADAVYAAYKTSALAAQYKDAYGPIVTLADMVTAMSTTESGKTYYLWLSWDEPADEPADEPTEEPVVTPDPAVCSVCGAEAINNMCTGCYLDTGDCVCKQTATPEDSRGKVTLTLNYNYRGAKSTKMKVERNAKIIDIIAGIPAPNRDGHLFSHWTMDQAGEDLIDEERVTAEGVVIYAQWDDDLAIGGKITIRVNLNYDRKMADPVTNIAKGTRMGDILDYVSVPSRWNHKFVGWYWDRDCTDDVEAGDKVYRNDEIFAKWEKRKTNNEIMLKIYVNGDTKSVAKIVDMYNYAKDGEVSMSEVKEVVKKYYTAKNADGMSFHGLFEADDWSDYVRNHKHHRGSNHIDVNRHDDTTIYVMVHNAKTAVAASSGTPDSSNPKTGDMIMNSVVIMGASAACLAALFFLNKKRAH